MKKGLRTLYVEVYRQPANTGTDNGRVSVHYMLRFIFMDMVENQMLAQGFRTLYVEVYLISTLWNRRRARSFRTLYVEVYRNE